MIPAKLQLSNFTSYGESVPDLDFSKFHLAAISGQNGAGKSSLLDSITWCLWGTSRLGDSSDQLVRLGQNKMWVEFAFELDGHIYTVKRQRSLRGGGTTALEFFSGSSTKGGLAHNLTEGTIKTTQQKIIDTLHLTYETFVNSAFLRQGHADEFTTKGPTERKRILADILGLSHFDLLEEKAKEKIKELQTKLQLLSYQVLELEAELSQKEEREKVLSQIETEAQEKEIKLKEIEKVIKEAEKEREKITNFYSKLQEKQQRLKEIEKELKDLKIQIDVKTKAQQEYQAIISQKEEIEKNCQHLLTLQEEKKLLDIKRSGLIKVKDELNEVQKVFAARKTKRDLAVANLQVDLGNLETINAQKIKENGHLKTHKDTCPTCGQNIKQEKNQEIISKNQKIIDQNNLKIKELKTNIDKYINFPFPEEKQVQEKELEVKKLEEATKNYQTLNQEINSLTKFDSLNIKLREAETAIKAHQETISGLEKIYQNREKQLQIEGEKLEEITEYEIKLQEFQNKLEMEEKTKQELSEQVLNLRGRVGAAKELVSRTTQLESLAKQKKMEQKQYLQEKGIFEELALAFGKKGIQTMIIETAIPEIEDETNRLLDKLTEGRMKVHLETQRETKGKVTGGEKGIVETLDIIISDEIGERPYEGYSGGEQFRVNFSIRLALSKLLTHRAGSKLQFLVIDEGFGTQDAQGRAKIVGALETIKNDFAKIVVITHLDELKEEFSTRIEVSKTPTGSTFQIVGA